MAKSKKSTPAPQVPETPNEAEGKDLKNIKIKVNEFGQIVKDIPTEHLNAFLDDNVPDKKL